MNEIVAIGGTGLIGAKVVEEAERARIAELSNPTQSSFDGETSAALEAAFHVALLLTGRLENAESAVLAGIDKLSEGFLPRKEILRETVGAALRQRMVFDDQVGAVLSYIPAELQCVGMLPRSVRQCFVLRVLLGYDLETCSQLMDLSPQAADQLLSFAVLSLAFSGGRFDYSSLKSNYVC